MHTFLFQGGSSNTTEADKKTEESEPVATSGGPAIDPVMQKYMDMVAKQKQKEKEVSESSDMIM